MNGLCVFYGSFNLEIYLEVIKKNNIALNRKIFEFYNQKVNWLLCISVKCNEKKLQPLKTFRVKMLIKCYSQKFFFIVYVCFRARNESVVCFSLVR